LDGMGCMAWYGGRIEFAMGHHTFAI